MNIEARPWRPQDLLDDLQQIIDEEPDRYLNTRRTTLCMALDYLKEHFTNCTEEQFEDVGHGMLYTNRDNVIIPKVVQFLSDGEIVPEVPVREV